MEFLGVIVLVVSFLVLLVLGVPIAFSIGISGVLTMLVSIDSLAAVTTFAQRMATGLDSFALLDFAEQYPMVLRHTTLLETGGMKGRRKELTRAELHSILKSKLNTLNLQRTPKDAYFVVLLLE